MSKIIDVTQLCKLLKIDNHHVYALMKTGHIKRLNLDTRKHYFCKVSILKDRSKLWEAVREGSKRKCGPKIQTTELPAIARKWRDELDSGEYKSIDAFAKAKGTYSTKVCNVIGLLSFTRERLAKIASGEDKTNQTQLFIQARVIRVRRDGELRRDTVGAPEAANILGVGLRDVFLMARLGVLDQASSGGKGYNFSGNYLMIGKDSILKTFAKVRKDITPKMRGARVPSELMKSGLKWKAGLESGMFSSKRDIADHFNIPERVVCAAVKMTELPSGRIRVIMSGDLDHVETENSLTLEARDATGGMGSRGGDDVKGKRLVEERKKTREAMASVQRENAIMEKLRDLLKEAAAYMEMGAELNLKMKGVFDESTEVE